LGHTWFILRFKVNTQVWVKVEFCLCGSATIDGYPILGIPELRVHEPPTVTVKENDRSSFGLHLTAQSIVAAQQFTDSLGAGTAVPRLSGIASQRIEEKRWYSISIVQVKYRYSIGIGLYKT
jgi:hypothetical protein